MEKKGSERGKVVELRGCHGTQKFLFLPDGSLLPLDLEIADVDMRNTSTEDSGEPASTKDVSALV